MKSIWFRPCTDVGPEIQVEHDNNVHVFRHLSEAWKFIGDLLLGDKDEVRVKSRGKLIVKVTK